jgi:hypothetical protein
VAAERAGPRAAVVRDQVLIVVVHGPGQQGVALIHHAEPLERNRHGTRRGHPRQAECSESNGKQCALHRSLFGETRTDARAARHVAMLSPTVSGRGPARLVPAQFSSVIFIPSGPACAERPWLVECSVMRTPFPFFSVAMPAPVPAAPLASAAVYVPGKSVNFLKPYT